MNKRIFALLILWLVTNQIALANEVTFSATAPEQVAVGERFRVVFSINKRPGNFNPPAFQEFRIVSGPNQSSSSSVQIINGQVSQTENYSFTYILEAGREGDFTIPGARITVNGREHKSNALSIRVSGQAPQATRPLQPDPLQPQESPVPQISERDLFVRATASRTNPFVGQHVVITYNLYTRVAVAQYSIEEAPGFQGFWAEDITPEGEPAVNEVVIDGQRYNVAVIRQVVVFPQRAGQLTIEPLEVRSLVRVASPRRTGSIFDDFFSGPLFGAFQTVEYRFRSNPVQITARELPEQNRPADFNGAVGNFDLKTDANPLTLNVNEPVSFTLTISGTGNLKMINSPEIEFPPHLEVFAPNTSDELRAGPAGMTGRRTFEYLIVPRTRGLFEIPSVQFSFFDPIARQFVTRTSENIKIEVVGDGLPAAPAALGGAQAAVEYLTSDIRFIQNHLFRLHPIGTVFFKSIWYYILLTLPVVLFGGFILFWKKHVKLRQDVALMKNRKAKNIARKRLKKASVYLREMKATEFYEEIFKALWGYVSDKFNIPVFKLNKDNVVEVFSQKGIDPDLADQFLATLDDCEFARFAPGAPESRLDETYQRTMEMLVNLEKNIRNG